MSNVHGYQFFIDQSEHGGPFTEEDAEEPLSEATREWLEERQRQARAWENDRRNNEGRE